MNLPNKITVSRIFLSLLIIILLIFPISQTNINFPKLFLNEILVVDTKYIIAGVLFVIAAITDIIDGKVARKNNCETIYGKLLDNVSDKILVYPMLIVLTSQGFIHPIVPLILITRDAVFSCLKNSLGITETRVNKLDKFQSILLIIGIALTLFYNLPFEFMNLKVAEAILVLSAVLSFVTLVQFYRDNEKEIKKLEKI